MLIVPAVVAYLLSCMGVYFYNPHHVREEKAVNPNAPLLSTILFTTGVTLVLIEVEIYPKSLRKLHIFIKGIFEFLFCWRVIEWVLSDVWLPTESFTILEVVSRLKTTLGIRPQSVFLDCIASYTLSISFIACVLSAVGATDLDELRLGSELLYKDMRSRLRKMISKMRKTSTVSTQAGVKGTLKKKLSICELFVRARCNPCIGNDMDSSE